MLFLRWKTQELSGASPLDPHWTPRGPSSGSWTPRRKARERCPLRFLFLINGAPNHPLPRAPSIKVTPLNKGNNFTTSIPSYVNSTTQPETINSRLASQLNIDCSTALIKVPVGSKPNNQSLHPFEHHPTRNTLNRQTLNITNNNQTQTLHVTNMRPYTKHSKYKPRKPRTALVKYWNQNSDSYIIQHWKAWNNSNPMSSAHYSK